MQIARFFILPTVTCLGPCDSTLATPRYVFFYNASELQVDDLQGKAEHFQLVTLYIHEQSKV